MEKRVLVAVSLSFLVLVLYQTLFVKPTTRARPAARPAAEQSSATPGTPDSSAPPTAESEATVAPAVPAPAAAPGPEAVVGETGEREIVVENAQVRAVFSNRGGVLKSWRLKAFTDDSKQPIDLVPQGAAEREPRAFSLTVPDAAQTQRLATALYRASDAPVSFAPGSAPLVFEYQDASGLQARKQFEFGTAGQPYVLRFSAEVTDNGRALEPSVSSGPGLGDTDRAVGSGSFFSPSYYQKPQGIFHHDGKVTRLPSTELHKQARYEGKFHYVGADDHYFLGVALPDDRSATIDYRPFTVQTPKGPRELVLYDLRVEGGPKALRYFLGPKQFDLLAATDRELVRAINFGIFSWLAVPLLRSLNWINGYVGNYGWSIIFLTLLINGVMFPLRHKSVVSMRKMQNIQPQVKAIQDRYASLKATDPAKQKMNTELMNLYREKGVNPASGCIPMLLTFPVLFAFYALLSQAIEIRGAPFVGWIRDLSTFDPLYITPILMGITMVWQQRLTPSTADPVQQKMMMFMPIMFTFMFLWAPSGLVIYWFVSNLWAIGQQYVTNRIIGPPTARAGKPSERRVRKTETA